MRTKNSPVVGMTKSSRRQESFIFQHNSLGCGQPSVFAFVKGLAMITSEKNREDVEAVIRFPPFDKIAIFEAYRAFLNKREMRLPGFYAK